MTFEMIESVNEPAIRTACRDWEWMFVTVIPYVSPRGVTPPHAGLASPMRIVARSTTPSGDVSTTPSIRTR